MKEPVLREFNLALVFFLETNASVVAILGILSQRDPATGLIYSVTYYSKKLTPAELSYITQEQELLAIIQYMKY